MQHVNMWPLPDTVRWRQSARTWLFVCFGLAGFVLPRCPAVAQSTQCLISGVVKNRKTGKPVVSAQVSFQGMDGKSSGVVSTGSDGSYTLPLLAPGTYKLKAASGLFQPVEYDRVTLAVAALLAIDFQLRPLSDLFEQDISHSFYFPNSQHLLNFYGPDIDTTRTTLVTPLDGREGRLTASISDVIDPDEIENLPLTGRDIYTALLLQPGVSADPAATRGLGFSVNGQRPSSSSFLLDGVEANDYLISGPLLTPAPEAIQEYRVSTSNFSAEYGGTSGYIANAVTRAGGARWNGLLYAVLMNDALNANGFQENLNGLNRPAFKQFEPGFRVGGPVWRRQIFSSNSFEYLRLRTRLDPESYLLPTAATLAALPNTESGNLLKQYRAVAAPVGPAGTAQAVMLQPTSSLNQYLGLSRVDGESSNGRHHYFLRAAISEFDRPDYYWTPYSNFTSGFTQNAVTIAAGVIDSSKDSHLVNEARAAWESDLLTIGDNNNGLPQLSSCDQGELCLPSSVSPFAYRNNGHTWQTLDNLTFAHGSHLAKFGSGFLVRNLSGYIRNGADGNFGFASLPDFLNDNPYLYSITVSRQNTSGLLSIPNYNRNYRYSQIFAFAQATWRINDRLTLNYGFRYEYSGAPRNVGSQPDNLVVLGSGASLPAKLAGATFAPSQANQLLYSPDAHDWAPRLGIAWLPFRNLPVLVRASYGIFYDRPYDNLWQTVQNNSVVSAAAVLTSGSSPYLAMARSGLSAFSGLGVQPESFQPTIFQPNLRNALVQSAFVGFQGRLNSSITLEINALASRGSGLLTTDFVNRDFTDPITFTNFYGRINANLPPLSYRANQGFSKYTAATALLKFNTRRLRGQVAYTLSHSIDNQSDPLAGDYNLEFSSASAGGSFYGRAAFVQQFNSAADIGNSDFDQRQSLVFFVIASLPSPGGNGWNARLLQGWQVSGLASLRSGFPFNAYAVLPYFPLSNLALIDDRANLIDPSHVYLRQSIPGGEQILNPDAFSPAKDGQVGTAGRNAFAGPGTISADASLSRTFRLPRLRESARLVLRADAFNVLNHPNLFVDAENPTFGTPQFGTAQFGTTGVQTAFPIQVPLTATPREFQLQVRLQF